MVSEKRIVVDADGWVQQALSPALESTAPMFVPTLGRYIGRRRQSISKEDDVPADIHDSDRYIGVPHKNDLGLGRRLALAFAEKECPADYETVVRFFQRRGACQSLQGPAADARSVGEVVGTRTRQQTKPCLLGVSRMASRLLVGK